MSTIVILHPTHSPMPSHIQMILGSFFQFLKHIDIGGFFSPLNISLGHNNLEMQTNTQT